MRRWSVNLILSLWAALFTVHVSAAENAPLKVLKVGVPEDYPPFYYKGIEGNFHGASYEIVTQICKKLGYRIEITQFSNMRLMQAELKAGRQHMSINLTETPERSEIALFTQTPHIFETQDLIVRADSTIHYNGQLMQIAPYRIGIIFGWTYGPAFDSATFISKAFVNDSSDQLRGLLSGRYDIAINNRQFFTATSDQMGIGNAFKILSPPIYQLPVSIAVSHNYPGAEELISALDNEVAKFVHQPEYLEILDRYGFKPIAAAEGVK